MVKPVEYLFPIVGRDEILEVFQEMLEDGMFLMEHSIADGGVNIGSYTNQSCLLIRGKAQMGKTRLLNELFHSALKNKKISALRLTLTMADSKVCRVQSIVIILKCGSFTETIFGCKSVLIEAIRVHRNYHEDYASKTNRTVFGGIQFASTTSPVERDSRC